MQISPALTLLYDSVRGDNSPCVGVDANVPPWDAHTSMCKWVHPWMHSCMCVRFIVIPWASGYQYISDVVILRMEAVVVVEHTSGSTHKTKPSYGCEAVD